jgi:methanogenic corrinoid protein MtbC1
MEKNLILEKVKKAVIAMDDQGVKKLVKAALDANIAPNEVLNKALISGMQDVGELFIKKEYYVPEVLLASESFYAGFNIISPLIKSQTKEKAKVVIGVVKGDIHDIGKNIVKVLIEAAGYNVIDLGKNVSLESFVSTVINEKPAVLAMSSLMTTTLIHMENVIKELVRRDLRGGLKVIIGGAPVTEEYAQSIEADGYAKDAARAVILIDELTSG